MNTFGLPKSLIESASALLSGTRVVAHRGFAQCSAGADKNNDQTGAFWYAENPEVARHFAAISNWGGATEEKVETKALHMRNPLVVDAQEWHTNDRRLSVLNDYFNHDTAGKLYNISKIKMTAINKARENGHDSVIFKNGYDSLPEPGNIYAILK